MILLGIIGVVFFKLELPTEASKWLTFAWVSILGLLCCTLLGLAFSSVPKSGRGAPAIVSPVVLVLQFTSGVFFVYSQLPTWMQHLASLFPLKWLVQGMQSVFLPESFASQTTGDRLMATRPSRLGAECLDDWRFGGGAADVQVAESRSVVRTLAQEKPMNIAVLGTGNVGKAYRCARRCRARSHDGFTNRGQRGRAGMDR